MNRRSLADAIRSRSKLSGSFVLRSGEVSDTYFDKYLFESDPLLLRCIAVVTVLSQVTGLPAAFIRKERRGYGTGKYAEGPELGDRRIVLVEDVVSSGGAVLDALAMRAGDGIEVDTAICVIDRETGGLEALAAHGVELRSLFRMSDIE